MVYMEPNFLPLNTNPQQPFHTSCNRYLKKYDPIYNSLTQYHLEKQVQLHAGPGALGVAPRGPRPDRRRHPLGEGAPAVGRAHRGAVPVRVPPGGALPAALQHGHRGPDQRPVRDAGAGGPGAGRDALHGPHLRPAVPHQVHVRGGQHEEGAGDGGAQVAAPVAGQAEVYSADEERGGGIV